MVVNDDALKQIIKESNFYKSYCNDLTINPVMRDCRLDLIRGGYLNIDLLSGTVKGGFYISHYSKGHRNTHELIINNLEEWQGFISFFMSKDFHKILLNFWYFINSNYANISPKLTYNIPDNQLIFYRTTKYIKSVH